MNTSTIKVTLEIPLGSLPNYTDEHIAQLWHVAQANPMPFGQREASELVKCVGDEIIKRFVTQAGVQLYVHQAGDHLSKQMTGKGVWNAEGTEWMPCVSALLI